MKLAVITGATRDASVSSRQSMWIIKTAAAIEGIEATHVDLKDYPLPSFNEDVSPRYNPNRVIPSEVQPWLDVLNSFDAYVFVTPEYNHSITGDLKNAFDYLTYELKHKPAAVASHGSVGGTRAAMMLKEILSEAQAVVIPQHSALVGMLATVIDEEGNLNPDLASNPYGPQSQLNSLLSELKWYSDALASARSQS